MHKEDKKALVVLAMVLLGIALLVCTSVYTPAYSVQGACQVFEQRIESPAGWADTMSLSTPGGGVNQPPSFSAYGWIEDNC